MREVLPIIRHDLDFNRSTIALFQGTVGLFGTSVKDILAPFNALSTFVTTVAPPVEPRPGMLQPNTDTTGSPVTQTVQEPRLHLSRSG